MDRVIARPTPGSTACAVMGPHTHRPRSRDYGVPVTADPSDPSPSLPSCLWLGLAGGMLAGTFVGLAEALWVLTGAGAGEYWALFAGALAVSYTHLTLPTIYSV